jgi:hypothetical protein
MVRQAGRQADKQTDMTKLIVAFGNSANAPKIGVYNVLQVVLCRMDGFFFSWRRIS